MEIAPNTEEVVFLEEYEDADSLLHLGDGIWILNDLKAMKEKTGFLVQNRCVFLLLNDASSRQPFLVVINPVALTDKYISLVRGLEHETGAEVTHLVSPGYKHHMFMPQWLKEFPGSRAYMFKRDASQPEQASCQESIVPFQVDSPDTILQELVSTGQFEVILHRCVGDGFLPTFTGKETFGAIRYNLWIYHKMSRALISGCQAWAEAKNGGPEPWLLRFMLGMKAGTVKVWGKILDQDLCKKTYEAILAWDFDAYVPIHGPYYPKNAKFFVKAALENHAKRKLEIHTG